MLHALCYGLQTSWGAIGSGLKTRQRLISFFNFNATYLISSKGNAYWRFDQERAMHMFFAWSNSVMEMVWNLIPTLSVHLCFIVLSVVFSFMEKPSRVVVDVFYLKKIKICIHKAMNLKKIVELLNRPNYMTTWPLPEKCWMQSDKINEN